MANNTYMYIDEKEEVKIPVVAGCLNFPWNESDDHVNLINKSRWIGIILPIARHFSLNDQRDQVADKNSRCINWRSLIEKCSVQIYF